MSDKKYLLLRDNGWNVRIRVPVKLVPSYGIAEVVRPLQTHKLKEANSKKHSVIAEIKRGFESMRGLFDLDTPEEQLLALAKSYRQKASLGLITIEQARQLFEDDLEGYFMKHQHQAKSVNDLTPERQESINGSSEIVYNKRAFLISDGFNKYIAHYRDTIAASTIERKRMRIQQFIDFLGGDRLLRNVSDIDCSDFVNDYIIHLDLMPGTKRDFCNEMSTFFSYLAKLRMVPSNYFEDLVSLIKEAHKGAHDENKRREWQIEEIAKLLTFLETWHEKRHIPFVLIALYSGMRSNEICEIELKDIRFDKQYVFLPEGKTESSVRNVPIHPVIMPLFEKLMQRSTDGYLFSDLARAGLDDKRNHLFGKRFGYIKGKKLGLPKSVVFHSLRKSFCGTLERMLIPENLSEQIVGHSKQSLTYRGYSDGFNISQLLPIVKRISYKDEERSIDLDEIARKLIDKF